MHTSDAWWLVFGSAFVATALSETFWPFRALASPTQKRWTSNTTLLAVSSLAIVCAYQLSGIALACSVQASQHGVLRRIPGPYGVRFVAGLAALDLAAYLAHRLFHSISPLWQVHRVHHSESDLDLTTGLRFHPVEALLTQGLLLATIALLGPPPGAAVCAGLAVVVQDFFTHANLRIPQKGDGFLRWLIITPAMHRVHHSELITDQNANFGTVFSLWDRLFGTYLAGHAMGAEQARYGLTEMTNGSDLSAARLLALPFRRTPTDGRPGQVAAAGAMHSATPSPKK